MKKLFKNGILFLILVIIINLLTYNFISKPVLFQGYFISKGELKENRRYLMGDSHAGVIQQKDLDKIGTLNFGFNSESFFDAYNKLNFLIKNDLADTILLCIDDHTLSRYREWWTNRTRSIYYADYQHYKQYYPTNRVDFLLNKYISFYLPLMQTKHSKILKAHVTSLITGVKPRNWDNFDFSTSTIENRIFKSKERIETQYPDSISSKRLEQCLNEMIELCQTNKIVLIGIKFPLTREFVNELGDRSYKADSVFEARGLEIFDYKYVFADSTSYFRDQDHLNYKGSEEFIRLLKRDLK